MAAGPSVLGESSGPVPPPVWAGVYCGRHKEELARREGATTVCLPTSLVCHLLGAAAMATREDTGFGSPGHWLTRARKFAARSLQLAFRLRLSLGARIKVRQI